MGLSHFFERNRLSGLLLSSFLLGVAVHSGFAFEKFAWSVFVALTVILMAALSRGKIRLVFLFVSAFFIGFWRFDVSLPDDKHGLVYWMGQEVAVTGTVVAVNQGDLIVDVRRVAERDVRGQGSRLHLKGRAGFRVGEMLEFGCRLRPVATFPSNIDQRVYEARKGVFAQCSDVWDLQRIGTDKRRYIQMMFGVWRQMLTARINSTMGRDEAALTAGVLYGEQSFSAERLENFRSAGLMHIIAVSGSNVTIVVSVIMAVVLSLGVDRRRAFWFVTVGIAAFVVFVGFSASVLRAALMGWLVISARACGRLPSVWRILLVAACALNLLNPWLLCFDAGFALSFLATLGLMVWSPLLEKRLHWIPEVLGLRESVAVTLGATIMTLPYLAWAFGRMTLLGIITNAIVLPFVPWLMLFGAIAASYGSLPGYAFIVAPAQGMAGFIIKISDYSRLLPWLDLKVENLDFYLMAATYLCLLQMARLLSKQSDSALSLVEKAVGEK
ncbi:MAG: ComEC/Rec2 family competence protein [Patescibacteria group bacterium]|nr:ComEC/Rec2 family competence protein [Patescibacteria group bacterium]